MQTTEIDQLFDALWTPYAAITPQAQRIRDLLSEQGERVVNDHVAFRTYNRGPYPVAELAKPFLELGYVETGRYNFEQKKLDAVSFSHPSGKAPRVFISELRMQDLPQSAQDLLDELIARIPGGQTQAAIRSELDWPLPNKAQYLALADVSEYAAWVSAFGLRVNHFTVSVNELTKLGELETLNAFLESKGFRLNGAPERSIKGNAECGLAQSSTVADRVPWALQDEELSIPSCYYEFAKRFVRPGEDALFDGFVTQSADKIFESTDRRHHQ